MTRGLKPYRPSRLELLPTELRQHVYYFLDFPIAHQISYETTKRLTWSEAEAIDYTSKDAAEKLNQQIFIQTRLKSVRFYTPPFAELQKAEFHLLQLDTGELYDYSLTEHRGLREMRTVASLNAFFAADVHSLILSNTEVIFDFPLHDMIHRPTCTKGCSCLSDTESVPQKLDPFPFLVMTSITLTDRIGAKALFAKESRSPHRARLVKLAHSIRYVATHCPNLRLLTIKPHHASVIKTKLSGLDVITMSLRDLVRSCLALQEVKIEYVGWPRDVPEHERLLKTSWEEGGHGEGTKVVTLSSSFRPCAVPAYLQEDAVAEWASGVLVEMRGKECERDIYDADYARCEAERLAVDAKRKEEKEKNASGW